MTTGPAHWELLSRARALDNQFYVATVSPARDETATYTAWGHSSLVNPWYVTSTIFLHIHVVELYFLLYYNRVFIFFNYPLYIDFLCWQFERSLVDSNLLKSCVITFRGKVIAKTEEKEAIVYGDIGS